MTGHRFIKFILVYMDIRKNILVVVPVRNGQLLGHLQRLLSGGLGPIPATSESSPAVSPGRHQPAPEDPRRRPVEAPRANPVVVLLVCVQRATCISWIVVQIPVHFFVFHGAMKTLQQARLSGGSKEDADMIEKLIRIVMELSGHEAAAVVGDQRRYAFGKTAVVCHRPVPSPTFSNSPGRAR